MARRRSEPTASDAAAPDSAVTGDDGSLLGPASDSETIAGPEPERAEAEAPVPVEAEPASEHIPPEDRGEYRLDDHPEDDGGPSFARRALTFLLLLLVGAGLGIWGAPKLAPMLPAGMAPVAAWLSPGGEAAEARIADLETRLDAGLGAVETGIGDAQARLAALPDAAAVEARVTDAVTGLESRTVAEIATLRDAVAGIDGAETRQRLARAEAAVQGQAAELAEIKQQITGGAAAAVGALSAETTERIDLYRAELEGLRAEMATLSDEVAGLASRLDTVAADAERRVEAARAEAAAVESQAATAVDSAAVEADLAQVGAALAAGLPFADAAERLSARAALPEPLLAAASDGVPSLAALRDTFPDAAHDAIRATIMASAGDGLIARSRAFLEAQVASRSLTPQAGPAPDAVLSRIEDRLRRDDLAGALDEAAALPSEATAAMSGWLDAARRRLDAEAALATLEAGHAATN